MYFYDANKPHLNDHPSRDKALADFLNKYHWMIDYLAGLICVSEVGQADYILTFRKYHTYSITVYSHTDITGRKGFSLVQQKLLFNEL